MPPSDAPEHDVGGLRQSQVIEDVVSHHQPPKQPLA
jgi:hypothetical protein